MRSLRLAAVAASLLVLASSPRQAAERDAEQILTRMKQVYSEASSYCDAGEVHTVVETPTGVVDLDFSFRTAFVRPNLFRFEFERPSGSGNRYVVWADSTAIRSWWSRRPGVEEHEKVEFALAGPTGVSYGAAVRIPALLMPEMLWGARLRSLEGPAVIGEESIGGRDCHVIEADSGGIRVWIDKESHLVRRMWTPVPGDGRRPLTLSYEPKLDGEIAPETFVFTPPS